MRDITRRRTGYTVVERRGAERRISPVTEDPANETTMPLMSLGLVTAGNAEMGTRIVLSTTRVLANTVVYCGKVIGIGTKFP